MLTDFSTSDILSIIQFLSSLTALFIDYSTLAMALSREDRASFSICSM